MTPPRAQCSGAPEHTPPSPVGTVSAVPTDEAMLRWVQGTRYYRRRVKSPEWWRSLPPERRLGEYRLVFRRLRIWSWVTTAYLAVLVLCAVAVTAFFFDPSVASVSFGAILMIMLLLVIAVVVRIRRRLRATVRRGRELVRRLESAAG